MENFIGKKIKVIRRMTEEELNNEGWNTPTEVIVLDNGAKLYPSQDSEGNDSGCLFGITSNGKAIRLLS